MNDTVTFSFKQHVIFLLVSIVVGSTCYFLDANNDNLAHYAKKSQQPQLMAQHSATEFTPASQHLQ